MDSAPCTCRGENSNCYKCFGTGMVPSSRRTNNIQTSARSANGAQNRRVKPKPQVYCGKCMVPIAKGQVHKCMKLEQSAVPKFRRPVCSYCNKSVKVNLQAHIRGAHPGKVLLAATIVKPNTCSICRIVAETPLVLRVHKERAHGIFTEKHLQQQPPLVGSNKGGPDTLDDNERSQRDGSYGWGGSFRDHGQFGSHPSFDPMDDESSAQ